MNSAPANDALFARSARPAGSWGTAGINASSCSFVVMLHGSVGSVGERDEVEKVASMVPGVKGVTNKLKVR